ncbi:hypothetical protein GCM10009117_12850 [Gangjinia marincola]|uniref:HTH araC/xylS-type domain-containing protein n=1 Tax=Gangjinia marincola TaxID=578463 RepID=A0ABN1MH15_9FLAO
MSKSVKLTDVSVKHVVIDMAAELGIEFTKQNNEYSLRLPEEIGKGYVRAIQFEHGVGVVIADYLLNQEFEFELKRGVIHPLKIVFNRENTIEHYFTNTDKKQSLRKLESLTVSATSKYNHKFKIPANKPVCLFSIEIDRRLFEEKIEDFLDEMDDDLEQIFRDVNGINLFSHKEYYSLDITTFMDEFLDCEHTGFMKSVYLEGKTYEILTHHFRQYIDDLNEPMKRKIFRQATVEKIEEAAQIIQRDLAVVDNVIILSKRVGLNQNTLQAGFKRLYKMTVNEYIQERRIEKAKELLENSLLNISEITYQIGINSRSYFSKIFKERFGINPKEYLERHRSGDDSISA